MGIGTVSNTTATDFRYNKSIKKIKPQLDNPN